MKNIKTLFWSSRPVSWINTAFPFLAGYFFVNGPVSSLSPAVFWVSVLYFLIPYNILIYVVNDAYDYESDMLNPRKGGVEGAVLAKELHPYMLKATAISNIPFLVYMGLNGSLTSNIVLLLCVINAAAYSVPGLRFKERPLADSISSSLHFVGPLIFAFSVLGWKASYLPYVLAFFFWGMASHAFGAVQDINPDRQAKLKSIATHFGAKFTVRLSLSLYLAAVVITAIQGWPEIVVALCGLLYPVIVWPYINLTDKTSAKSNNGWRHFMKLNQILGFSITIILILAIR